MSIRPERGVREGKFLDIASPKFLQVAVLCCDYSPPEAAFLDVYT